MSCTWLTSGTETIGDRATENLNIVKRSIAISLSFHIEEISTVFSRPWCHTKIAQSFIVADADLDPSVQEEEK